jgi:hypothetical protein
MDGKIALAIHSSHSHRVIPVESTGWGRRSPLGDDLFIVLSLKKDDLKRTIVLFPTKVETAISLRQGLKTGKKKEENRKNER